MSNAVRITYTDPETGETEVFRSRPTTTDERLDRIIELLEQIAEQRVSHITVNCTSADNIAAEVKRILNEQIGVRR